MILLPRELSPDEIHLDITLPVDSFPEETASLENKKWATIGQERAVMALEMGMAIHARGYNIFVAGEPGTSKHSAVMDIISRHRKKRKPLRDIAYVHNFKTPEKPHTIIFPEGKARQFKEDLRILVENLSDSITRDLDTKAYKAQRDALISKTENFENKTLSEWESQLSQENFRMVQTDDEQEGEATDIIPIINGNPSSFEELQNLVSSGDTPAQVWNDTRERYFICMDKMKHLYKNMRLTREKLDKDLTQLKLASIRSGISKECARLRSRWEDLPLGEYLENLEEDVWDNFIWFTAEKNDEDIDLSTHYSINIVVDRYGNTQVPVIHETSPNKVNIFGSIEAHYGTLGELRTNMMMINAGSLLQADGGFLIIQADDLFAKEDLWPELKRALQTGHVVPELQTSALGSLPVLMKPEPILTESSIILMGPTHVYESFCSQDDEFGRLFKIVAEFSSVMKRNLTTEQQYAVFARTLVAKEKLLPITPQGIGELIAHGILLAENRTLLSTHFNHIADLIREANYHAGGTGKETIDACSIREATQARTFMNNLPEQNLLKQIKDGSLLIETKGMKTGTVNGLAVLERGFYSFGAPLRITAVVAPGKNGLTNIEREAGLSGELHDKGVFLLEGYLHYRYARQFPFSLSASIAIEQSYDEIDGDSASVAELVALLSAISNIPIRQDLALTGSINQRGTLQPVGGIHEKVNGFFHACQMQGLTGKQGVILPQKNIHSVILPPEVIEAIKKGLFHIWIAETIDQVISLLSGLDAGKEQPSGHFTRKSFNEHVRKSLDKLSKSA